MTQDEIIKMLRNSGAIVTPIGFVTEPPTLTVVDVMERFAKLVAQHTLSNIDPSNFMSYQEGMKAGRLAEREACARVCDSLEEQCEKLLVPDEKWPTPSDCANIIRARGQA
jgi:hypothetical protein